MKLFRRKEITPGVSLSHLSGFRAPTNDEVAVVQAHMDCRTKMLNKTSAVLGYVLVFFIALFIIGFPYREVRVRGLETDDWIRMFLVIVMAAFAFLCWRSCRRGKMQAQYFHSNSFRVLGGVIADVGGAPSGTDGIQEWTVQIRTEAGELTEFLTLPFNEGMKEKPVIGRNVLVLYLQHGVDWSYKTILQVIRPEKYPSVKCEQTV